MRPRDSPAAVLLLAWNLEDRGIAVRLATDGSLLVGPKRVLPDTGRAGLRRWSGQIKMLLRHFAEHEHDAPLILVVDAPPVGREALL